MDRFDQPVLPRAASPARLRSVGRLARRKERIQVGRFLAEGPQCVREALARPGVVAELYVAHDALERHRELVAAATLGGVPTWTASPGDLARQSTTVTPQGVVAVCRAVDVALAEALAGRPRRVVLCDQIRDPGNLGAVIRCADAFGADAVLISRASVELSNPKVVRATTGSLFHLPIAVEVEVAQAVETARSAGLAVYGADAEAHLSLDRLAAGGQLARPVLWVLGNEARGLPAEHLPLLDRLVAIPAYGRAESLNLATAAAVLLYATAAAQQSSGVPEGELSS